MTWKHVFLVCFALALVTVCGLSSTCQPMMSKLGDLAMIAISAAAGNALGARDDAMTNKEIPKNPTSKKDD